MDPIGKKEELLFFWGENVQIYQLVKSEFYIEVEIEGEDFKGKCWIIFTDASTDDNIRKIQWDILKKKRSTWGQGWIMGGILMK